MYEYDDSQRGGKTVVGYGLALNVKDGKATVVFHENHADFLDVLRSGELVGRTHTAKLDSDQRQWLDDMKTWVKQQLEDSE